MAVGPGGPLSPKSDGPPHRERPLWDGRPSWRAHYGTWALCVLSCAVAIAVVHRFTDTGSSLRVWVWAVAAAASIALLVREALLVYGQRYRLTSLRLFVDRGILMRVTDQTELYRVDDVRIRQSVVDRMVDTGDIEILGSDMSDESIVLRSVHCPAEVAENLLRHVRKIRDKKTLLIERV